MRQVPMFEEFRSKSKEAFPGRSLNQATEILPKVLGSKWYICKLTARNRVQAVETELTQ
jgi:hypothetical protein